MVRDDREGIGPEMMVLVDRLARLLRANGSTSTQSPDDAEALLEYGTN